MTETWFGYAAIGVFIIAYLLVIAEEFIDLRKSKPVMLAAGIIWILTALAAAQNNTPELASEAIRHTLLEYLELFLFILVAMTYVSTMETYKVFGALQSWLMRKNYSYRTLFWVTGILSFCLSPLVDNLTTALIMCAVVMAVGIGSPKFVSLACINIVVAANAGGAFSPFGDLTTLMVWQKGVLPFQAFFAIFIPAVINFGIPAFCMHFALPKDKPLASPEKMYITPGGKIIIVLFALTIITTIIFQHYLKLPATVGMMMGLAYLQIYCFYLKRKNNFNIFDQLKNIEWDTLLFFYGIMLCVGGLAAFGYLAMLSEIYVQWGHTQANIAIGLFSAIIDNIPMIYVVLTMNPDMSVGQWLLVTLTTGVGGSLLAIGSAAGVALMGQAKGQYTFMSHLKWSWAIMLGYIASIAAHLWLNQGLF